jgi:hypothetical protein
MNTRLYKDEKGDTHLEMKEYDATPEGLFQSYLAHFEEWIPTC